jgi:hypothetical protein
MHAHPHACAPTHMRTHMHAFSHACLPTCMRFHTHVFSDHPFLNYVFSHACVFTHMHFHMDKIGNKCIPKCKVAFLHACICRCTCFTINIARTIEKTQHVTHQPSCSPHNCSRDAHLPRVCSLIFGSDICPDLAILY